MRGAHSDVLGVTFVHIWNASAVAITCEGLHVISRHMYLKADHPGTRPDILEWVTAL